MTKKEFQAVTFFIGTVRSVQGHLSWYASDYNTKEIQCQAEKLDEAINKVSKALK